MYKRRLLSKFVIGCKEEDEFDIFGANTMFRRLTSNLVKKTVSEGNWFSFCTRIDESQVDIMSIRNNMDTKIGTMMSDIYSESDYRTAIYKYLLSDYLCYYEAPMVKKDTYAGYGYKNSYNKFLATSNINVVAKWLRVSVDIAEAQLGGRLSLVGENDDSSLFPYVKLYETKEGVRKITRPRSDLDLSISGTRVTPLYALKAGVDHLYKMCSEDFYDITFLKDGGQKRTINTTFDANKLREIYGDGDFLVSGLSMQYNGDFLNNPNLDRGYIRVFEAGASKYGNPTRSINYARIINIKKNEPDLAFVNIDLDTVVESFIYYVERNVDSIDDIVQMLDAFEVGGERLLSKKRKYYLNDLTSWVNSQNVLLSTVFQRQLALFMLANPMWFEGYTGGDDNNEDSYESNDSLPFTNDSYETDDYELDLG